MKELGCNASTASCCQPHALHPPLPAPLVRLSHQAPPPPFPAPSGLFYFDQSFRPVPLALAFVGVTPQNFTARNTMMTEVCYSKVRPAAVWGGPALTTPWCVLQCASAHKRISASEHQRISG